MARRTTQGTRGAPTADRDQALSLREGRAACNGGLSLSSSQKKPAVSATGKGTASRPKDSENLVAAPEPIACRRFHGTLDDTGYLAPIPGHEHLFHALTAETPQRVEVSIRVLSGDDPDAQSISDQQLSKGEAAIKQKANVPKQLIRKVTHKKSVTTRAQVLKRSRSITAPGIAELKSQIGPTGPAQFFIGDQVGLNAFYEYHLKEIGMAVCKKLAWMWISVRWPRRSGAHPYLKKIPNTTPPKYDEPRGYNGPAPGWPAEEVIYTEPAHLPSTQVKRLLIYFLRAHRELDEKGRRRADTGWITKLELAAKSYVELGFNLAQDYSTSQDTAFQDLKEQRTKECIYACYEAAKSEEDFYMAYDLYDTEDTNRPELYSGKTITWCRKDRIPRPQNPNRASSKRKRRRHGEYRFMEDPVMVDISDDGTEEAEEYTESHNTHCSTSFSSSRSSQLPLISSSTHQRQTSVPPVPANKAERESFSSFPMVPHQPTSLVAASHSAERQDSWLTFRPQIQSISSTASSLNPFPYTSSVGQSGEHTGLYHTTSNPTNVRQDPGILQNLDPLGLQMVDIHDAPWNHQVLPPGLPYLHNNLTQEQLAYVNMTANATSISYPTGYHESSAPLSQYRSDPEHLPDAKHWMDTWDGMPASNRLSPDATFVTH